jgi:site-specific DNA recombinase
MIANAVRREELKAKLAAADAAPPLLYPEMADLYRQKVTALAQALEHPETRTEASEALRGLIDVIVLTPNEGEPLSRAADWQMRASHHLFLTRPTSGTCCFPDHTRIG